MKKQSNERLTFGLIDDNVIGWEDSLYYQSDNLKGVEDFAKDNDINLICFVTGRLESPHHWERNRNILFDLVNKDFIDGLIIRGPAIGQDMGSKKVCELMEHYKDIPIVFLNTTVGNHPSVCIDNSSGIRKIMEHLIEVHNYKRIAFIKGPSINIEAQIRFEAYLEALNKYDISFDADLVYSDSENFNYSSGAEAIKFFLDKKKVQFDCIVAANDNMAIGALVELNARPYSSIENPHICGFDDIEVSKLYSLTTVKQPFYFQAQSASKMLLKLIKGESTVQNEFLDVELIVRSSCGCTSNSIVNQTSVTYDLSDKDLKLSISAAKQNIISELKILTLAFDKVFRYDLLELEIKLMDALCYEIGSVKKSSFFYTLNNLALWMSANNLDMAKIHEILSIFRKNIIPCLSKIDDIANNEAFFHDARVYILDLLERTEISKKITSYIYSDSIQSLEEDLFSSFDLKIQMDILYRELIEEKVTGCCIVLFENSDRPLEYARLLLAFNGNERLDINNREMLFPTKDFLPAKAFDLMKNSRFVSIVQALYIGDTQLGYAIFNLGSKVNHIFESIRHRLSFALKNSLIIEKMSKQAQNLEILVTERTSELTETNRLLEKQIEIRRNFENQLKKALDELELNNKKLYDQSFKDELTGLYNRRGFMELGLHHHKSSILSTKGFWIFFADMDNLKKINDIFGHKEGDFAISHTAQLIKQCFREIDIIARLGGDEFTFIIVNSPREEESEIHERLFNSFKQYNDKSEKPYKLSISIGSAYFDPNFPLEFEELLSIADKALYSQKLRKGASNS